MLFNVFEPKLVDSLLYAMIEFFNHGIQGTATWSQLSLVPPSDGKQSNADNDESTEECKHEECIVEIFHSPWTWDNHQYGWRNSGLRIYDRMVIADCLHAENGNCLSHAICDDSVTLMPLIQFIRALFSDGGDTAGTVQITFIFIDFRVCDFAFAFKTQNAPCVSRFKRVLFSDRFQFAF